MPAGRCAAIARALGRHRSTISRDLARHRRSRTVPTAPTSLQREADDRARRPKVAKLAGNPRLRREVQDRLQHNHSPEQIARRLRQDYPDEPEMWVSHETIYQSIYVQARGGLNRELARHLRTGRMLRKPRRAGRGTARPDPGHGQHQPTTGGGGGPGGARPLGRGPDHGVDRLRVRGRHPGRAHHPVRDAAAPARRSRRAAGPGGDDRRPWPPCPSSCAAR